VPSLPLVSLVVSLPETTREDVAAEGEPGAGDKGLGDRCGAGDNGFVAGPAGDIGRGEDPAGEVGLAG